MRNYCILGDKLLEAIHSWHEHDALEIQHFVDRCIEGAVNSLEAGGWAKESIRVIGMILWDQLCVFFLIQRWLIYRNYQST